MVAKIWSHKKGRWVDVYIEDLNLEFRLQEAADMDKPIIVSKGEHYKC